MGTPCLGTFRSESMDFGSSCVSDVDPFDSRIGQAREW